MKKTALGAVIVAGTLLLTSSASADYVIKLKNGRTVETAGYWEEKDELKFQWQGGVASLPRKNVVSIVEVEEKFPDRVYKEKEPSPAVEQTTPEPKKQATKGTNVAAPSARESKEKEIDPAYYKAQKAHYTQLYEEAYERYVDAAARRDKEAKNKAWEEFNLYGGKVISMEAELKKKNDGVVPQWWKE